MFSYSLILILLLPWVNRFSISMSICLVTISSTLCLLFTYCIFQGELKHAALEFFYSLFTFKQAFWQLQQLTKRNELKSAATDIKYFARRKFSRSLVHNNFELDMTSSFQVRIHILSRKVGYLFWAWMNSEKSHERQ